MSMVKIDSYEVTNPSGEASVTFNTIPQDYTDLLLLVSLRTTVDGAGQWYDVLVNFNGVGTNQSQRVLYGAGSGSLVAFTESSLNIRTSDSGNSADTFGNSFFYISDYRSSASKSVLMNVASENNSTAAFTSATAGLWNSSAPITSISLVPLSGNIAQYSSATLYGITAGSQPLTYTLPVTSDLYAWYDAANTSSITASSGLISEWADSSGNGVNAVQATGSLQPAYGPVVVNGVPVPYFNVDRLVANASLVGNALTVFTVGSKESQGGTFNYSRWASIWKDGAGANDYNNVNSILGVWANTIYAYGNNATIATISSSAVNTIQNSALRLDGSNVKIWSNGSTATGTTSVSLNADRITIGDASQGTGDSYLNGFVAEHIIYNRALTDAEVADVQTYLANKWNL